MFYNHYLINDLIRKKIHVVSTSLVDAPLALLSVFCVAEQSNCQMQCWTDVSHLSGTPALDCNTNKGLLLPRLVFLVVKIVMSQIMVSRLIDAKKIQGTQAREAQHSTGNTEGRIGIIAPKIPLFCEWLDPATNYI